LRQEGAPRRIAEGRLVTVVARVAAVVIGWLSSRRAGRTDCHGGLASDAGLNLACNLFHLVDIEWLGGWAIEDRAGGDVEPGSVALAHGGGACQQPG
jgi:hypothetical protein